MTGARPSLAGGSHSKDSDRSAEVVNRRFSTMPGAVGVSSSSTRTVTAGAVTAAYSPPDAGWLTVTVSATPSSDAVAVTVRGVSQFDVVK